MRAPGHLSTLKNKILRIGSLYTIETFCAPEMHRIVLSCTFRNEERKSKGADLRMLFVWKQGGEEYNASAVWILNSAPWAVVGITQEEGLYNGSPKNETQPNMKMNIK